MRTSGCVAAALGVLIPAIFAGSALAAPRLGYMKLFTDAERAGPHVTPKSYPMPHDFVDGQWEGIIAASDGKTYFGVSSHSTDRNAQFYSYDPKTDQISHIIDLGAWCGETDSIGKQNTQGKIHSQIFEADGKLYCSTTSAHMPKDFPYKGGHFLSYDLKTGKCEDLGCYRDTQGGLLTMYYEPVYRRLYAISQGDQTLVYYDLKTGKIVKVGSFEDNPHQSRTLISDKQGNVYGSTWDGMIIKYDARTGGLSCLLTRIPHDPAAAQPKPDPSTLHWRDTKWKMMVWDPKTEWWYGLRGNDEYLFRFRPPTDPKSHRGRIEGLAQIGFRPSAVGQPRYGSLGLCLRGRTLWYCSYPMWRSQAHLMSYNIDTGRVTHHGKIVCEAGRRVAEIHSLVAGSDGTLHAVAGVWSIKDRDPAKPWSQRAQCYYHARFLKIDPQKDLTNP